MRSMKRLVPIFCCYSIRLQAALKTMEITKIDKPKGMLPQITKKRVAAYARVSTHDEDQLDSLSAQRSHYETLIKGKSEWIYAGVYYDEGITGTSYAQREAFQRMISECEQGKIDMIITKSISRFARNTVDTIEIIRRLKSINVGVFFEKENIWSLDSKGEFVLTLMAGFAQEEARSLSENTAWGIRRRMESGKYWVAYSRFIGYGPGFEIEDDGAAIVRRIFKYTIQGYSSTKIARLLEENGIPAPMNGTCWHESTVMSILHNEKYKGDALSQKQFIGDFLTKKRIKNRGQLPQYYVTGGHKPIIPPELFDYVQELLDIESRLNIRKSGCNLMSNKLICGKCGASYGPKPIHSNDKYAHVIWQCRNRFKKGVCCRNLHFHERDIPMLWSAVCAEILKKHPGVKRCVRETLLRFVDDESRKKKIIELLRQFPSRETVTVDMEEIAILIEYVDVYDYQLQIHLFGGKAINMTLSAFGKRKN